MSRYCYGWWMAARAFRMARAKKHGGGKADLWTATRLAAGYRFIVDGQYRTPMRAPFYLRHLFARERLRKNGADVAAEQKSSLRVRPADNRGPDIVIETKAN